MCVCVQVTSRPEMGPSFESLELARAGQVTVSTRSLLTLVIVVPVRVGPTYVRACRVPDVGNSWSNTTCAHSVRSSLGEWPSALTPA